MNNYLGEFLHLLKELCIEAVTIIDPFTVTSEQGHHPELMAGPTE